MDRMAGLQDLQDKVLGLNLVLFRQDCRIVSRTKLGVENGQDCRITGFTG